MKNGLNITNISVRLSILCIFELEIESQVVLRVGSIVKRRESRIIPIETVKHNDSVDRSEMKVELVSPVQQVIDQAASEIKREKTIKRPSSSCPKQSTKRKQRKTSSLRGKNDGNQF